MMTIHHIANTPEDKGSGSWLANVIIANQVLEIKGVILNNMIDKTNQYKIINL